MIQTDALVMSVLAGLSVARVVLKAPEIVPRLSAGQFALADLDGAIRSPLFPSHLRADVLETILPLGHPAATLRPGMAVNLIGPLGHGFRVDAIGRRLLLVASIERLPVLLPLVDEGAVSGTLGMPGGRSLTGMRQLQERSMALLLFGSSSPDSQSVVDALPPELEVHVADSAGGDVTQRSGLEAFAGLARWADCVCIAGEPASYLALAQVVRDVRVNPRADFAQALVVPPMLCGVGACQGCAVRVARGIRLACTDGPVFDLLELE